MQKVHCICCGLYLGSTLEEDFPVQVTCRICEEHNASIRALLTGAQEPEFDNWLSEMMCSNMEGRNAVALVQRIVEHRELDFYEFPATNGGAK